jgi:hypothetical protein
MATRVQQIANWLNTARWDSRQRASRYKEHIVGQGWQQPYNAVVKDAQGNEVVEKRYKNVPGFNKGMSASAIKVDDVENMEWIDVIKPSERRLTTPLSWRSRLGKNVRKPPMILSIKINPRKGIMLVTFSSNGAEIAYDHVPREVMAELMFAAKNDQDGATLGKTFWDIVRYRGAAGGSKYPWWTVKAGTTASTDPERQMTAEERKQAETLAERALDQWSDPSVQALWSADEVNKWYHQMQEAYDNDDHHKMVNLYLEGKRKNMYR